MLTRGNYLLKAVYKLVPLESTVDENSEDVEPVPEVSTSEETDTLEIQVPTATRPKRCAAAKAEARLLLLADNQL